MKEKIYLSNSFRLKNREKNLNASNPFDINFFKKYYFLGNANDLHRSMYWRVFLGYYPSNKFKTEMYYKKQRKFYKLYISDTTESSNEYFKIIENDVSRVLIKPVKIFLNWKCDFLDIQIPSDCFTRREILIRILKCFVVHNKSIGYVQGMVMILIPIYSVFIQSKNKEDQIFSEEDSFYCFNFLVSKLFENFICEIDTEQNIKFLLDRVWEILKYFESYLFQCCVEKGITESHIILKWIIFLFATEFNIDDLIWLWDRLLNDQNRFELVYFCAVAIFKLLKEVILKDSYDKILQRLQDISILDVKTIFNIAYNLRREYNK